jgi:hypothetical protein
VVLVDLVVEVGCDVGAIIVVVDGALVVVAAVVGAPVVGAAVVGAAVVGAAVVGAAVVGAAVVGAAVVATVEANVVTVVVAEVVGAAVVCTLVVELGVWVVVEVGVEVVVAGVVEVDVLVEVDVVEVDVVEVDVVEVDVVVVGPPVASALASSSRSCCAPSNGTSSAPKNRDNTVAYTERKSIPICRLPWVSSVVSDGGAPKIPPLTWFPMTIATLAAPWSVPPESFSSTRRPNSEYTNTTVLAATAGVMVAKSVSSPASKLASSLPCQPNGWPSSPRIACSLWVSKPPNTVEITREPMPALSRRPPIII